jgi:guanylate kinase
MEAQVQKRPVLITLTAPSATGKSYLFNYIRDVAKLPCLISTTTRAARSGEVEGLDYFFISEEESKRLEAEDQLAELAIYNGVRYGVTKQEFQSKLSQGLAFLIVEPSGIDHYVKPALDVGAIHYKVYIHVDPQIRMKRFRDRAQADMLRAINVSRIHQFGNADAMIMKELNTSLNRLTTMLTEEIKWGQMHQWDRTIFGDKSPEENLEIILKDVKKIQQQDIEASQDKARIQNRY